MKDFRDFILRGNVVDLAVGIVIGAAFGAVVTAFVTDILTPIISIPGKIAFTDIVWTVNGSRFLIGAFINQIISFLLIAFFVFYLVVKPVNTMMKRFKTETPVAPVTRDCPFCLSSVPKAATRCPFCTSEIARA